MGQRQVVAQAPRAAVERLLAGEVAVEQALDEVAAELLPRGGARVLAHQLDGAGAGRRQGGRAVALGELARAGQQGEVRARAPAVPDRRDQPHQPQVGQLEVGDAGLHRPRVRRAGPRLDYPGAGRERAPDLAGDQVRLILMACASVSVIKATTASQRFALRPAGTASLNAS